MDAIILAGGLGTRLKPFTDVIPKPMLPLGEKSLMEVQLEHLKRAGVQRVFVAVNYKANYVKSFFGNGHSLGLDIEYSEEDQPLGTCGPVKLLENELTEPFILMNGDVLTKLDFREFYNHALSFCNSPLTIGTKVITTPFRFGSIHSVGHHITSVEEKPELTFEILSGIYVLKPEVLSYIPKDEYYGIDTLIHDLLAREVPITKYVIHDYWIDIGVMEDYEEAQQVYQEQFELNGTEFTVPGS